MRRQIEAAEAVGLSLIASTPVENRKALMERMGVDKWTENAKMAAEELKPVSLHKLKYGDYFRTDEAQAEPYRVVNMTCSGLDYDPNVVYGIRDSALLKFPRDKEVVRVSEDDPWIESKACN